MKGLAVVVLRTRASPCAFGPAPSRLLGKIVGASPSGAIATFDFAAPIIHPALATAVEAAVEIQKSLGKTNANLDCPEQGLVDSQGASRRSNRQDRRRIRQRTRRRGRSRYRARRSGNRRYQQRDGSVWCRRRSQRFRLRCARRHGRVGPAQVAYAKVNEMVEKASVVANKMAEAKKLEMDATLALAQMVDSRSRFTQQPPFFSEAAAAAASREYARCQEGRSGCAQGPARRCASGL